MGAFLIAACTATPVATVQPSSVASTEASAGSMLPSVSATAAPATSSAAAAADPEGTSGTTPVPATPTRASVIAARVVLERQVCPPFAREPVVATHPSDPRRLAVVCQRFAGSPLGPRPRFSDDGGRTWHEAARSPWAGSGRWPDFHAAIAWGPGPTAGSARLYWFDVVSNGGGVSPASSWTDDEGIHWSALRIETRTPPWVGGFPDVAVDRDPSSPSFGVVYAAYNWLASSRAPGLRVLASGDFGRTWAALDVPRAPAASRYPDSWRIGYRLAPAPDGSVYVAGFQADMADWGPARLFSRAGAGRVGYSVTRLAFDRTARSLRLAGPTVMAATLTLNAYSVNQAPAAGTTGNVLVDPGWQEGLAVDPTSGRILLAVSDMCFSAPGKPRGVVLVYASDDRGLTWNRTMVPAASPVAGAVVSSFRPELVVLAGAVVWVGFHTITDVALGTSPSLHRPSVGTAFAVSTDDGSSFQTPVAIDAVRWNAMALTRYVNGPGLRDRAAATADGRVFYAWGDGRVAAPSPSRSWGASAVYGAVVALGD